MGNLLEMFKNLVICAFLAGLRATRNLDKCQICEAVVTQVDNELEREETEVLIDSLLEKVCKYLPFNTTTQVWAIDILV